MSTVGHWWTLSPHFRMSASPPKADVGRDQAIATSSMSDFPTRTTSPTSLPSNARATGETYEIVPRAGSASSSPDSVRLPRGARLARIRGSHGQPILRGLWSWFQVCRAGSNISTCLIFSSTSAHACRNGGRSARSFRATRKRFRKCSMRKMSLR
jgi:hypothetical protein